MFVAAKYFRGLMPRRGDASYLEELGNKVTGLYARRPAGSSLLTGAPANLFT